MKAPSFVVVLACNKIIRDKDITCKRISINVLASEYTQALTGKNHNGWRKLRWLYINRHRKDIALRWLVISPDLQTVIAVNRGPNRGSDGPQWAVDAIEMVAYDNGRLMTQPSPMSSH